MFAIYSLTVQPDQPDPKRYRISSGSGGWTFSFASFVKLWFRPRKCFGANEARSKDDKTATNASGADGRVRSRTGTTPFFSTIVTAPCEKTFENVRLTSVTSGIVVRAYRGTVTAVRVAPRRAYARRRTPSLPFSPLSSAFVFSPDTFSNP